MKILLLNGNPNPENKEFENYIQKLSEELESKHQVEKLIIRDLEIKYCSGCWACWVKTPGQCITKDHSYLVCQKYINSDFVIFASPLIMGFTSAILKNANDKLLPLILPYIKLFEGECHHEPRYKKYPQTALLTQKEEDTDDEDLKIVTKIYQRNAVNLQTQLLFSKTIETPVNEICHEINHI